jgi:hypothetical protein
MLVSNKKLKGQEIGKTPVRLGQVALFIGISVN